RLQPGAWDLHRRTECCGPDRQDHRTGRCPQPRRRPRWPTRPALRRLVSRCTERPWGLQLISGALGRYRIQATLWRDCAKAEEGSRVSRSAFNTSSSELADMPIAANNGVTQPMAAK